MKQQLRLLYELQLVDDARAELAESRGDLPAKVETMRQRIVDIESSTNEYHDTVQKCVIESQGAKTEIIAKRDAITKFKLQQMEVRSNREYDAFSTEIENAEYDIRRLTESIHMADGRAEQLKMELSQTAQEVDVIKADLAKAEEELAGHMKSTAEEEKVLTAARAAIIKDLSEEIVTKYEHMHGAKGSHVVALIRRGVCSSCFQAIPPQQVIELRKLAHYYVCENCGRIVISDEVKNLEKIVFAREEEVL